MISLDDLTECFSTDDFAVTATVTLTDSSELEVSGYLDDPTSEAAVGEVNVEAVQPTFTAPTSELYGVTRNATVTYDGTVYKVVYVRHAGNGVSVCYLK